MEDTDKIGKELEKNWGEIIRDFEFQFLRATKDLPETKAIILADAFFFKALQDFKVVHFLLINGHVTQAACVACSLFEYSLHALLLLKDETFYLKFKSKVFSEEMELFKVQEMTNILGNSDLYVAYRWLCKSKHPTFEVTHFDAIRKSKNHTNLITEAQDYAWRTSILAISTNALQSALYEFEDKIPEDKIVEALDRKPLLELIDRELLKTKDNLPYNLAKTTFGRKWNQQTTPGSQPNISADLTRSKDA